MQSQYTQRILKETKDLRELPNYIQAWPKENIFEFEIVMSGPIDTVYEGGKFLLELSLPMNYPFNPPNVVFKTFIFHPNVDEAGRICLDILKMPPNGSWSAGNNIYSTILTIYSLLSNPNPDDPLNVDAANLYKRERESYDSQARKFTKEYANGEPTIIKLKENCNENNVCVKEDKLPTKKLNLKLKKKINKADSYDLNKSLEKTHDSKTKLNSNELNSKNVNSLNTNNTANNGIESTSILKEEIIKYKDTNYKEKEKDDYKETIKNGSLSMKKSKTNKRDAANSNSDDLERSNTESIGSKPSKNNTQEIKGKMKSKKDRNIVEVIDDENIQEITIPESPKIKKSKIINSKSKWFSSKKISKVKETASSELNSNSLPNNGSDGIDLISSSSEVEMEVQNSKNMKQRNINNKERVKKIPCLTPTNPEVLPCPMKTSYEKMQKVQGIEIILSDNEVGLVQDNKVGDSNYKFETLSHHQGELVENNDLDSLDGKSVASSSNQQEVKVKIQRRWPVPVQLTKDIPTKKKSLNLRIKRKSE